ELELDDLTFLLGPNGAGKTAVLQALARLFSFDPARRKVKKSDFHVPYDENPDEELVERELWIEADFEFPEVVGTFELSGSCSMRQPLQVEVEHLSRFPGSP
ncbi:DUF2813 domain-containing protein, partial [Mesorhizobium sp. M2E.F.Ca.ET.209.01.1.1]